MGRRSIPCLLGTSGGHALQVARYGRISRGRSRMGHMSYLHGYIIGDYNYAQANRDCIANLPANDTWPYLTRDLFAVPAKEHSYDGQLISFGTAYNGVETNWEAWLSKFEALLRSMYWLEAHVYLQTEIWGAYHYVWKSTTSVEISRDGLELPVQRWTFSGGPRTGLRDMRGPSNA